MLAEIYTGKIKTWNNAAIANLNKTYEGELPNHAIETACRSDKSGTTYIFTNYLNVAAPTIWTTAPSKSPLTCALPGSGNQGVASNVENNKYSLGYVEYSYLLLNPKLLSGVVAMQNKSGVFLTPSLAGIAAGAAKKPSVSATNFSIVDEAGKTSYPIIGYTWAIIFKSQSSLDTGTLVVKYLDWLSHSFPGALHRIAGQNIAGQQGYVPLPSNIQHLARVTLLGDARASQPGPAHHQRQIISRANFQLMTQVTHAPPESTPGSDLVRRPRFRTRSDRTFWFVLYGVSRFFLLVCLAFIASVVQASWPAWSKYGLSIVYGTTWNQGNSQFGALPLIAGTFETTAIALVLAVPIGIGTALAITHLLHRRLRTIATSVVSVLASVPSVVYGLWGLWVVGPYFADHIQPWLSNLFRNKFPFQVPAESLSLLLAGFILSIMVLPLVVALSRDAIASVPKEMEEGALSLGASRWQVFRKGHPAERADGHHGRGDARDGPSARRDRGRGDDHRPQSSVREVVELDRCDAGLHHRDGVPGLHAHPGGFAGGAGGHPDGDHTRGQRHRTTHDHPSSCEDVPMTTNLLPTLPEDPILERRKLVQSTATRHLRRKSVSSRIMVTLCGLALVLATIPLLAIMISLISRGAKWWSVGFFTS